MRPTQAYLQECFEYLPEGRLRWKVRPRGHFPTVRGWKIFNRCYAGNVPGSLDSRGYLQVGFGGRSYLVHRLIWVYHKGFWAKELDHINRIRIDNRIENLRVATREENTANAALRVDNSSGSRGVHKQYGKWCARIQVENRRIFLGYFASFDAAACAYAQASIAYRGEFAP